MFFKAEQFSNDQFPKLVQLDRSIFSKLVQFLKLELFMLGLRMTDGVKYSGEFPKRVNPLIEKGLLELSGDRLRLTKRGTDCANLVFMEFLDD